MKVYEFLILSLLALLVGTGLLWGVPQYNVYRMKLEGEAKLAESQASRQVLVSEALAKKEAASLLGQAKLIDAEFQAKAAMELSSGLTPEYLQYSWINSQGEKDNNTIVYIPTNNLGIPSMNLPITEANRLNDKGGDVNK